MEEEDRRSYPAAHALDDAITGIELRFEARLRELLADPEGQKPILALFSRLADLAQTPVSDRQAPDCVMVDGEQLFIVEAKSTRERVYKRLWRAAWNLRLAKTTTERRDAASEFLAALAELSAQLLNMLARVLLVLLSQLLGRTAADDVPVWKPVPMVSTPQIAPRGPNYVFPVTIHRGGHRRSTLGSVVRAA